MTSTIYDELSRIRAPRQERSRRAFESALNAFDELLRERPYGEVGVQEVADRAGLSVTSVYARFDGKASLVLALHERTIAVGLDGLDRPDGALPTGDASVEQIVRTIVARAVRFADEHAHVFRAVVASGDAETSERAAGFIRRGSELVFGVLVPTLESDAGTAERDVDFAWRAMVAVLQQSWMLNGAEPARFPLDHDALVDRLTHQFLATVTSR